MSTDEELVSLRRLKDNLRIESKVEPGSFGMSGTVTLQLLWNDELIDESFINLQDLKE